MPLGGGPICEVCDKTVYFSEEVTIEGKKVHRGCGFCSDCNRRLDAGNGHFVCGKLQCTNCRKKSESVTSDMANTGQSTQNNGPNACPKCGKTVYMAEEVRAVGKKFHKSCFTCSVCNTRLDSTTLCNKEDKIYCKSCYAKEFGPKGYGYGQGAGALQYTK